MKISYIFCAMLTMITVPSCPMEVTVQLRVYATSNDTPVCCALLVTAAPEKTMSELLAQLAEEHNFAHSVTKELYLDLHTHPYMQNAHQSAESIQQAESSIQKFFGANLELKHVSNGFFKAPMTKKLGLYKHLLTEYAFYLQIIQK